MGNEMGCDPCPGAWCDESDPHVYETHSRHYYVRCRNCGLMGPGPFVAHEGDDADASAAEAVTAWNTRLPTIPAQAGVREDVQWEVYSEEGDLQASSDSEADSYHYLAVYSQDGPHKLVKATRFRVDVASTPAATEGGRG